MSNSLASLRGAVAKTSDEPRKKTVRDIIMERQADIAKALPAAAGMTPERLTMVAYTLVHSNPKLGGCTPQSLIGALMTAAQLGLEPGPQQHVYFIPRWNSRLKAENASLEQSVKELQSRLTDKQLSQSADEARGGLYSSSPSKAAHGLQLDASTVENALKRGEREKHLELMVRFCVDAFQMGL